MMPCCWCLLSLVVASNVSSSPGQYVAASRSRLVPSQVWLCLCIRGEARFVHGMQYGSSSFAWISALRWSLSNATRLLTSSRASRALASAADSLRCKDPTAVRFTALATCSGANDLDGWSFARSGWLESTACAHAQLPGTVTAEGHGARYGLTHQSQREHDQHEAPGGRKRQRLLISSGEHLSTSTTRSSHQDRRT
jgi:hypothetical protein